MLEWLARLIQVQYNLEDMVVPHARYLGFEGINYRNYTKSETPSESLHYVVILSYVPISALLCF